MEAPQFRLPKIPKSRPLKDEGSEAHDRYVAPPVPVRPKSPVPDRKQRPPSCKENRPSPIGSHIPHRVVNIPNQRKAALLNLDKKDVDIETLEISDLAKLVTRKVLPVVVELKRGGNIQGCSLELPKGLLLQLHFLHKTTRIYATDSVVKDVYLPLFARQLYTVLPIGKRVSIYFR